MQSSGSIMKVSWSDRCVWLMLMSAILPRCESWLCLHFRRWSLNGTLIDLDGDERRHVSGGNLIINTLDRDQDAGVYQCSAANARGIILSHRATVQFACKFSGSNSAILSSSLDSASFWQRVFRFKRIYFPLFQGIIYISLCSCKLLQRNSICKHISQMWL